MIRDVMSSAAFIASIAVVIVVMFMAPKRFQMADQQPIVTSLEQAAPQK